MSSLEKIPEPKIHIPFVHNERTSSELAEKFENSKEYQLDFEGQKVTVTVFDFRGSKTPKETNVETLQPENNPISLYFMGFPNIETVKPNDLTGGVLDRAKEKGQVVLIPRFKEIPVSFNAEHEMLINALSTKDSSMEQTKFSTIRGELSAQLKKDGILIDFSSQDVDLIGYSDGGRTEIQLAALINDIPPKQRPDGTFPKRTCLFLSSTSLVDEVDISQMPTGETHTKAFNKQVEWAVIEEIRLRINSIVSQEKAYFNDEAQKWISTHGIKEDSESYFKLQETLLEQKDDAGFYKFPYLRNGFKLIPDAPKARDPKTTSETIISLSKMLTFKQGLGDFAAHVTESSQQNLGMLFDVLRRASTGLRQETYEELLNLPKIKLLLKGLKSQNQINKQFAPAEVRLDHICDSLETFDVKAVLPIEDLIAPDAAFGRTLSRLLTREYPTAKEKVNKALGSLDPETRKDLIEAVEKDDFVTVGEIFINESDKLGIVMFPNAKSVSVKFVGKRGHMSGTHLAPMKNSGPYIE